MKSFKGKTIFYFSIVQDQDINLLNLLDISKYYRLLGLTRVIWYCYFIRERVPDLCRVVDSSRSTVISSGRSELREAGDYMPLYYQCRRFRFKCSCSIAFLRNVEPQGSAEYNARTCFVPLKGYFF